MSTSSMPLLTIGIPTYKQPAQMKRLLERLTTQATPNLAKKIEILIRDDSPDAATEEIVRAYEPRLPIRYIHGEKIGIDGADLFLIEQAKGEHVWWFGDDDMAPGAVAHVVGLLESHPEIDFMWINSQEQGSGQLSIDLGESRFLRDANEAVEKLADLLGFLSALLFRRSIALESIAGAQKYLGSNFGGLYPVIYVLSRAKKVYYLGEPYVIGDPKRPEDQLFYDSFQVFAITFYQILAEFRGKLAWRSLKIALAKNFRGVWTSILVYRAKGQKLGMGSSSVRVAPLFPLYWSFPEFWLALPFLLMPRWAVRWCYRAYKFFSPETKKRL